MKTRKALSLFFCTVAFAAGAATVSVDTVKLAAGSWALSNASLGVPHGKAVSGAAPYNVDGSVGFYAVSLEGGGTVFLAADDEIGPVIGFTSSSEPDLTEGSPLRILLEKDIAARRGILAISSPASNPKLTASSGSASASIASASSTNAKALWSALAPVLSVSSNPKLTMASATPRDTGAISDMRVEPLVESQWSQQTAGGEYCYNYYTPDHDPCGCTATAAAQIMRYFQYPDHVLDPITRKCSVNDITTNLTSVGDSRSYDWASMKLIPKNGATDTEREAIGRLTYDVGVALYSDYTSSGTGADPQCLGELYQDTYDYASGVMYWNESGWDTGNGGLHTRELRNKIIYANLDAKRPVQLAIYGWDSDGDWAGHSVVCDGYGFVAIDGVETEFAHVNMGWAGTDDMWYNIPEINAANSGAYVGQSGIDFLFLGGAQFNIHPTETGDLLTGRVVDDGEPVENATVSVYSAGSSTPIATTTTDVHGIYSFCLEGGKTYDVKAVSADGKKNGTADGVLLQLTVEDVFGEYVHNVTQESHVGNSWGNDIDIAIPHVRIVGGNYYPNLNSALVDASTMENPIVEIFGPTLLKAPVTITTNVTIRTVPGPSADYPNPTLAECEVVALDTAITTGGWALQVADGVRVDFSNIVVRAESGEPPVLDVLATGKAAFAGRIDLGTLGTVATHAADAFILAGPLELEGNGLAVSCPVASGFGLQFGTYECSDEEAGTCVRLIANALDATLTGVASGGVLVWDRQPIDPSIAIAYATNDVFGIKYYSSVDLLFSDYTNGAEVVFLKDCPVNMFTNAVVVGKSMTIRSDDDSPFVVTLGKDASFTVQGENTELVFTNIVFKRTGTPAPATNFVTVKGGASLVLASGATIADLQLAGTACAVSVDSGKVTMQDGSAITNCAASGNASGKSAGIYLKGANSTFDFAGGLITGCRAGPSSRTSHAGGVYAENGATVRVSGSASAYGNKAGVYTRNIYVQSFGSLILADELTGEVGVYCNGGTVAGKSFATVEALLPAALASLGRFHNDYNASLFADTSEDFATLVWAAEPPGPKPVPEVDAEARLIVGSETNAYATVGDAFEAAGLSDARIELVTNASLSASITVSSAIVFDGMGYTLSRAGNFCISVTNGAQLIVTNMTMNGGVGIGRILDVRDGSLTLEDRAIIENVNGTDTTACVAAVVIWGGKFTMNSGSEIKNCKNPYVRERGGPLAAGGVVTQNSKGMAAEVYLNGGKITGCSGAGYGVGGISIGSKAVIFIKGDAEITGNTVQTNDTTEAIASNLIVQDLSGLTLNGELARNIGYTEGVGGNTNVFGTVDADFVSSTTPSNVAVSARCFRHDLTGAKGMVATNETEAILVWSSAIGDSDMFTNVVGSVTNVYNVIRITGADVKCEPFAFVAIEEVPPGTWKLTLKPGTEHCVYTLMGSSDLKTWTAVGSPKELSSSDISDEDLKFVFEVEDSDGNKFWKVEGANGTK